MDRKATWKVRMFGMLQVRTLVWAWPSVVELNHDRCVVKIPLNWRTRNHYRSMYIGIMTAGADCAGGLLAMQHVEAAGGKVRLLFKDFRADFLKRAEGDVHFTCPDGALVGRMVERAIATGERQNETVHIVATVPSKLGEEPVATFELTLSLK